MPGYQNWKTVTIAIQARDEASATLQRTEHGLGSLRGALARFGGAWIGLQAVTFGLQAIKVAQAAAAREAAAASGPLTELVDAHVRFHDALREAAGAVPILGGALGSLVGILSAGDEALKRNAAALGRWREAAAESAAAALRYAREAALAEAETPGRKAELGLQQKAADRAAGIEAERRALAEVDRQLAQQRAEIYRQRAALAVADLPPTIELRAQWAVYKEGKRQRDERARSLAQREARAGQAGAAEWEEVRRTAREAEAREAEQARREADEDRRRAAEQARRAAKEEAERAAEKSRTLARTEERRLDATRTLHERELAALDVFYREQREKWQGHADVLAALQDAFHAERARLVAEHQRHQAEAREALEDEVLAAQGRRQELEQRQFQRRIAALREQFRHDAEAQRRIDLLERLGTRPPQEHGPARGAPLVEARMLTRAPGEDPVRESNRHLANLVALADREDRRRQREGRADARPLVLAKAGD